MPKKLLFHHCTDLEALLKGEILTGDPQRAGQGYENSYKVWSDTFGFHPIFLAMGCGKETVEITGYPNQFSRVIACGYSQEKKRRVLTLRPKGECPNRVLLSFEHVGGLAHKFTTWEDVLFWSFNSGKCPVRYLRRLKSQTQRPLESWMRSARKRDGYVQLCTPSLNPRSAARVWVRNQKTKKLLEKLGYQNVEVQRMPARKWWK